MKSISALVFALLAPALSAQQTDYNANIGHQVARGVETATAGGQIAPLGWPAHLEAVAERDASVFHGRYDGRHFGGGVVRQTIVEMDTAFLFVTSAGEGSCLAVLSPASADAGLVAYEMAILVKRVGQHLSVNPRPGTAGEVTD